MPKVKKSIDSSLKGKAKPIAPRYTVMATRNEQTPWNFPESEKCAGTIDTTLDVADYTLEGHESVLRIERKGAMSEFAKNIGTADAARFRRELEKLNEFQHAYVILEFSMDSFMNYPYSDKSLPRAVKARIRTSGRYLLHKLADLEETYPNINFIFAGSRAAAMYYATVIFNKVFRHVDQSV
jgi:hypothetical protein